MAISGNGDLHMIKKILIIAFNENWVGISRLPSGLDRAGFEVFALCPRKSYLANTKFLKKSLLYPTFTYSRSKIIYLWMVIAFIFFKPDLIIPGDEDVILGLQNLSNFFLKVPFFNKISKIIRQSMTAKDFDLLILNKSDFQKRCTTLGIRTPKNIVVDDIKNALIVASKFHYPIVIKVDAGYGGHGVLLCTNQGELIKNLQILQTISFIQKIKFLLKDLLFISILSRDRKFSLQQYIQGTEGQAPFCSKDGNVFGHNSMIRLRTLKNATGQSTVTEGIENLEIAQYVQLVAKNLNYTGFGSLEFIIEEKSGLPYVIELNPRPTPTCHLANTVVTNDLCSLFFKGLNSHPIELQAFRPYILALFPGELKRDPKSHFLTEAYHDIPVNDSQLVAALMSGVYKLGSPLQPPSV